ncbi:Hypothetical protein SAMN05414139_10756 [Burkholderia sp. D7]|nr:Hypothetical protein SAMN05414139_10756 [Burkholderia sp. D7]
MRIDHDYIKRMIDIVLDHPRPTFTIEDFDEAGLSYRTPEFEFHMKLFNDQQLIEQDDGDAGFGLFKSIDGHASWSVLPLRLTSKGHDFAEAISEKSVWDKVKKELPGAAMSSLVTVSVGLAQAYAKQRLGLS